MGGKDKYDYLSSTVNSSFVSPGLQAQCLKNNTSSLFFFDNYNCISSKCLIDDNNPKSQLKKKRKFSARSRFYQLQQ